MLICFGSGYTNSMPRISGSERTNIRPCDWRGGVSASHTCSTCRTFLPSLISRSFCGNASRFSSGPLCARVGTAQASSSAPQAASRPRRRSSGRRSMFCRVSCMAIIVAEFHPARKVEVGENDAFVLEQASRRAEAEAARRHAVDRVPGTQGFHAFLRKRIHSAFVVVLRREDSPFSFEENRHVGAQPIAWRTLGHARDAEHQADAMAIAAGRAADADAHAVADVVLSRRQGTALALHLGVLPVQVEVERSAHARAQVTATYGKTAHRRAGHGTGGRIGRADVRDCQSDDDTDDGAGARRHAPTVARTLYCQSKEDPNGQTPRTRNLRSICQPTDQRHP